MSDRVQNVDLDEKYQHLDEIDHVLLRPGRDLGNVHFEIRKFQLFRPANNCIELTENVAYNAGLLKLIDEVLTNSIDERVRKSRLYDINKIDVFVSKTGNVIIQDDGGIPIHFHKGMQMYLPKMIFGTLRSSANYGNDGDRDGAGLNGLGAKLSNIFSTRFRVTTCDGKQKMDIQWSNNMKTVDYENITDSKEHYTRTDWDIDLKRFDIEELDLSTIRVIQKRCIDGAASSPGLIINFKTDIADGKLDSAWQFDSFQEYVRLHTDKKFITYQSKNLADNVALLTNIGYNYGFVNGAVCSEGTHMKKLEKQIVTKILDILKKKDIELITETDILNRLSIFCSVKVTNPDYDSQAKTKLSVKIPSSGLLLSEQFLNSIADFPVIQELVDYYNIKYLAEQKKELRKLNAMLKVTKTNKLITCSNRQSTKDKELWLFEGTSASEGFESARDPQYQAAYLLRGKVKNTFNLNKAEIVANQELREIIAVLGIQFNDPKGNIKNCKFKKIVIATDADTDGSHITGLLIVFFAKNFPELFVAGYIYRALSPIIVASKKDEEKLYYSLEEYNQDIKNLKGWQIDYKKGLGALEDHHYEDMVGNQRLEQFVLDKNYLDDIEVWFSKSTEQRKAILAEESNMTEYSESEN